MPEGYHRGLHRQDEPRIPRRHRDLRRKGLRKGLISGIVILEGRSPDRIQGIKKDRSDAALFAYRIGLF